MSDFKVFDENGKGYIGCWAPEGENKAAYKAGKPIYIPPNHYTISIFQNDLTENANRPPVTVALIPAENRGDDSISISCWANEKSGKALFRASLHVHIPAGEYWLDIYKNDLTSNPNRPPVNIRLKLAEPMPEQNDSAPKGANEDMPF